LAIRGAGPLTSEAALRTPDVWDDGHIHFFTAHDLEWLARTAGFSRIRTEALIALDGRMRYLRQRLNLVRSRAAVKGLLCGNLALAAWK
jgi:hypothetical protein